MTPNIESDYPPMSPETAMEQCVLCGGSFEPEDESWSYGLIMTDAPAVDIRTGEECEALIDTDPSDPMAHPECYRERVHEVHAESHQALDQFAESDVDGE